MSRIYIVCLAAYNAGELHGRWIDVSGKDISEAYAEIGSVLRTSPVVDAEEWAAHDYDGIPSSFGEYPDLADVLAYVEAFEEHGTAFYAWWSIVGDSVYADEWADKFQEDHQGCFDSIEEYAERYIEDTGMLASVPDSIARFFDYAALARDLEYSGDIWTVRDGCSFHVFNNY